MLAGAVLDDLPEHWREALAAIAQALRAVYEAQPWMVSAAGQRLLLGPNLIRHVEQGLSATASLDLGWNKRLVIMCVVDTYVLGYAQVGSSRRIQSLRARFDETGSRTAIQSYLQGLLDTGQFSSLDQLGANSFLADFDKERIFETGLDWLLTSIAVQLGLPSPRS